MLFFFMTFIYFKGLLLKWNFWKTPQDKKCFDDQAFWEVINIKFIFVQFLTKVLAIKKEMY